LLLSDLQAQPTLDLLLPLLLLLVVVVVVLWWAAGSQALSEAGLMPSVGAAAGRIGSSHCSSSATS
jgi:hypothetical protein